MIKVFEDKWFNIVCVFIELLLYVKVLGMELVEIGLFMVVICMFYDEKLIGDFEIKVIYGGVVFVLMDICCGIVVMM